MIAMSCDEHREQLMAYLDGELGDAEAEEVRSHLEECETCRDDLEKFRRDLEKARQSIRQASYEAEAIGELGTSETERQIAAAELDIKRLDAERELEMMEVQMGLREPEPIEGGNDARDPRHLRFRPPLLRLFPRWAATCSTSATLNCSENR